MRASSTESPSTAALDTLDGVVLASELLAVGGVMVLSGAGLSTESGIPDYRGPSGHARNATPMTYEEFTRNDSSRQRYWARSHVGWKTIGNAMPNVGHDSVASFQNAGCLSGIVTQNVDGLHQAAGANSVIELHGNLFTVICLACRELTTRTQVHQRLQAANPQWDATSLELRPDGDAVVSNSSVSEFQIVACSNCGGMLKPNVVFFGESVPKERVLRCFDLLESSTALFVLGSSLTVMSGYRFVLRAVKIGIPIVIINQGPTRGDSDATLRIDAPLGEILAHLAGSF